MENSKSKPLPSKGASRTVLVLLGLGLVITVSAFAARHHLFSSSDPANFDSAPLARPRINAPFITSSDAIVERMVEFADLSEDDLVYDLGCGDGRIVITASLLSGCKGVGFDIDPERVAEAKANAEENGVSGRVTIEEQDVFKVDLSKVDAVMMYLLPWMMNELVPQFQQMKPGARIVSHDFPMNGFRPDKIERVEVGDGKHVIYLWTTPLKPDPSFKL